MDSVDIVGFSGLFAVQVYYELEEERKRIEADDVALLRVEQLCPFPYDLFIRELNRYPSEKASFSV